MWGENQNRAGSARALMLAVFAASSMLAASDAAWAADADGPSSATPIALAASAVSSIPLAQSPARAADAAEASGAPPLYVRVDSSPSPYIASDDATAGAITADVQSPGDPDATATPVFIVGDQAGSATSRLADAPLFASTSYERALQCMTMAIAYEAGQEPTAGKEAVGEVILNRIRAGRFPKTVCGVVFEGSERATGCQFTFTCDGSMRRRLMAATIQSARLVAQSVLAGLAPDRVGGATNYHANYVLPYWASSGARVARIGAHIFYRMPGDGILPGAVVAIANEPDVAALRAYALGRQDGGTALARLSPADSPHAMFAPWGLSTPAQR